MSDNTADIDAAAAEWATRLDSGPLDAAAAVRLDEWLSVSERHAGALLRAEATLAYLDRGRALTDLARRAPTHARPVLLRRRSLVVGGAVGGLAAAAGVIGLVLGRTDVMQINTTVGEMRRVPLADGSTAAVNTNSKLAVLLDERRREVKLQQGEAWFQVAHDATRPFVVEAGDVRVRAVGTAFSVRKGARGAEVLVTEGTVETWVVGREDASVRLKAGSGGFVDAETSVAKVRDQAAVIDRKLAWRAGELALNGESLAYAVNEFNRYNVRRLVVDDAQLGREPLVGYFRTDQPERFGRSAARLLGAKVTTNGHTITLSR